VDEAHSFGVYGDRGLGVAEMQGELHGVDFVTGTFSKALGGVGGFVVSDHAELPLLHVAARGYVFTAAGTPATVAAARAALAVLLRDGGRRRAVRDAGRALRRGLRGLGLRVGPDSGPDDAPIVPVVVGGAADAIAAWQALLGSGVYVNLVLPPGCPRDACQLRASVSAAHGPAEIARAIDAFAAAVPRAARAVAS
jgi:8-amino-7-oxononanoate synthase